MPPFRPPQDKRLGAFTANKTKAPAEWQAWHDDPSDDNYSTLMDSVQPTIQSGLTSYGGGDTALKTRANILAAQAMTDYDPAKGASLNTHIHNRLQRLQRFRAARTNVVHIPENVRLDRGNVSRYSAEYLDKHGYDPSISDIADRLNMSQKRVQKALGRPEATSTARSTEKGDLPGLARSAEDIWADYVYHDLDERNKKIFEWTTGYGGTDVLPKKDIAKRLGITPAAVSLRISNIMTKLQEGVA